MHTPKSVLIVIDKYPIKRKYSELKKKVQKASSIKRMVTELYIFVPVVFILLLIHVYVFEFLFNRARWF